MMARSIRIQYPGAIYHVMARGNRREAIFLDEVDRRGFLKTLGDACGRTGWRVHAWVLMGNHYHLLIETPEPNLVEGMQWLQNTLTRRFNVRHRAWGRVFGDRYKAILVEGSDAYYYGTVQDYIHLNPARARLIQPAKGQSVLDYEWSSIAGAYALPESRRPPWMAVPQGLKAIGLPDTAAGRRQMVARLDRRAVEEEADQCGVPVPGPEIDARSSHLRRGWYWGSQSFAEHLLKLAKAMLQGQRSRGYKATAQRRSHGLLQAERWLAEGLGAADFAEGELEGLKGSDPRKLAMARLLWQQTTVSQEWLARALHIGSAANVSQQLRRLDPEKLRSKLPPKMKRFLDAATKQLKSTDE
jgi:putative transposase